MSYAVHGRIVEWEASRARVPEDVLDIWEAINADASVPGGAGILVDGRRCGFTAGRQEVEHLAQALQVVLPKAQAYALVLTAGTTLYGLGNQFRVYTEIAGGPAVGLFGDPDAARAWLKERLRA